MSWLRGRDLRGAVIAVNGLISNRSTLAISSGGASASGVQRSPSRAVSPACPVPPIGIVPPGSSAAYCLVTPSITPASHAYGNAPASGRGSFKSTLGPASRGPLSRPPASRTQPGSHLGCSQPADDTASTSNTA